MARHLPTHRRTLRYPGVWAPLAFSIVVLAIIVVSGVLAAVGREIPVIFYVFASMIETFLVMAFAVNRQNAQLRDREEDVKLEVLDRVAERAGMSREDTAKFLALTLAEELHESRTRMLRAGEDHE